MRHFCMALALLALSSGAYAEEDHGEQLYNLYCTQCHGVNGDGKGVNAATMSIAPRDHTDTKEMTARSDEELFKVIQQGGKSINKSILMPVWGGNLNDDDINALVKYLRKLCCQGT